MICSDAASRLAAKLSYCNSSQTFTLEVNFMVPVITLPAWYWIDLRQSASWALRPVHKGPAYSKVGLTRVEYALWRHLQGMLWLAAFIIPRVLLNFTWIWSISFVHFKSFESVTPKCLWDFTTSSYVWFIMMGVLHLSFLLFEINITLAFEAFTSRAHSDNYWERERAITALWRLLVISKSVLPIAYIEVSSAKMFVVQLTISGNSLTYIMNMSGPSMLPWGTPTVFLSENWLFSTTRCYE